MNVLLATTLIVAAAGACRRGASPRIETEPGPQGEPERYSATVVRSIDDGELREVSEARVSRLGVLTREDWTEMNRNWAVIWRPDLGKAFALDMDRRVFAELELGSQPNGLKTDSRNPAGSTGELSTEEGAPIVSAARDQRAIDPESVDRAFAAGAESSLVDERTMADERVEGYQCAVAERQANFPDGRSETTRWFRARELSGLALRVEIETRSQTGYVRAITERRDIRTDVSADLFEVPPEFKKVKELQK